MIFRAVNLFKYFYCLVSLLFLLNACESVPYSASYLHIAHTRSYSEAKDKLMPEVEEIDFKAYDVLMLGGDLVFESTGKRETLEHLDSIFDLSNWNTLWTLGNHDYHHHPEWISEVTGRPKIYNFEKNGIKYLVLDSQEDNCNTAGRQLKLFGETLLDLNPDISHLIVLHHKLLWMLDNGPMQEQVNAVSNGGTGGCFHCILPNNFYEVVYPELVEIQKKGIQVICIAGDIGAKVSEFEFQSPEGIYFLASGLKDGAKENKALVFEHDIRNGKLEWRFEDIDKLPKK